MTWEEYQTEQYTLHKDMTGSGYWAKTEAKCPECGGPIYKNIGAVLACFPAKYRYECWNCKWEDVGF